MTRKKILLIVIISALLFVGATTWYIFKGNNITENRDDELEAQTNTTIWKEIEDTTWFMDDGWAGTLYVFYKDNDGNERCIRQVQGSGVYIVESEYRSLEITSDTSIKIGATRYELTENKLVSHNNEITRFHDEPIVYSRLSQVPMEIVRDPNFDPAAYLDYYPKPQEGHYIVTDKRTQLPLADTKPSINELGNKIGELTLANGGYVFTVVDNESESLNNCNLASYPKGTYTITDDTVKLFPEDGSFENVGIEYTIIETEDYFALQYLGAAAYSCTIYMPK